MGRAAVFAIVPRIFLQSHGLKNQIKNTRKFGINRRDDYITYGSHTFDLCENNDDDKRTEILLSQACLRNPEP